MFTGNGVRSQIESVSALVETGVETAVDMLESQPDFRILFLKLAATAFEQTVL